ncbi:MAG: hypothetical protein JOZ72_04060 [Alphaproteobacteria bacterium]|nr:hypothetical protein [Alphaproteobacteria bacterium]
MTSWLSGSARAALAGAVALGLSPAVAEDVRFPATFKPGLMLRTPKGWTSQTLNVGISENLVIDSPDHTIELVISLSPTLGSPDLLAAKLLKAKPQGKTKARFAGLDAFAYRGTATNPDGLKLNLKLVVAPIDPQEAYTCMLITAYPESDKALAPANALIAGVALIKK